MARQENQGDQDTCLGAGRYLSLVRRGRWEFVHRHGATDAVCIVAVTDAGEILLVEQYRPPLGRACIELPAGLVGDTEPGEDVLAAAQRELLEETGFTAADWRFLGRAASSAGMSDEAPAFYLATALTQVEAGGGHDGEDITVHRVPLCDMGDWLAAQERAGLAVDVKVLAAPWLMERPWGPQRP
ncbi:MAG: NUDIX hydrolase [Alphaproteobacteria bacterium]|nr:MAG: NUDIX hydrolase [Alphaproteobacteria bacterium]